MGSDHAERLISRPAEPRNPAADVTAGALFARSRPPIANEALDIPMRSPLRLPPLVLLAALAAAAPAAAQQAPPPTYERYTITAEASGDVANDLLVATLAAREEGEDPAELADRVNRTMTEALSALEAYPAVIAKTLDYRTEPRYGRGDDRPVIGWSAVQTLELRTADLAAGAKAVGELQENLRVRSTRLEPAPATRRAAEDALITEALEAFTARATLVERAMGASGHRVVQADVQTEGGAPVYARAASSRLAYESDVAEPGLAAGTGELTVRVYGTVELERPDP